jgi:hypothetical protein
MECVLRGLLRSLESLFAVLLPVLALNAQSAGTEAIRQVDFRNFTYQAHCLDKTVTVQDGRFSEVLEGEEAGFSVTEVIYGDLTADGQPEAVVRTFCWPGRASQAFVITMRDGKPMPIAELGPGYGAIGGIRKIWIADGALKVETLWTDDASTSNPKAIEVETYRWQDDRLVLVGQPERRPYVEDKD